MLAEKQGRGKRSNIKRRESLGCFQFIQSVFGEHLLSNTIKLGLKRGPPGATSRAAFPFSFERQVALLSHTGVLLLLSQSPFAFVFNTDQQ